MPAESYLLHNKRVMQENRDARNDHFTSQTVFEAYFPDIITSSQPSEDLPAMEAPLPVIDGQIVLQDHHTKEGKRSWVH